LHTLPGKSTGRRAEPSRRLDVGAAVELLGRVPVVTGAQLGRKALHHLLDLAFRLPGCLGKGNLSTTKSVANDNDLAGGSAVLVALPGKRPIRTDRSAGITVLLVFESRRAFPAL
jgi:hypothetical protein